MKDRISFLPADGLNDVRTERNSLGVNHGWFYIHFLVSLTSIKGKKLINKFPAQFNAVNQVEDTWFTSHLNEDEFSSIIPHKEIEIFKITKKNSRFALKDSDLYSIRSYKNWKPKYPYKELKSIGYGFFVIKGASLNDLQNDEDILSIDNYKMNEIENRYTAGYLQNGVEKLVFEGKHYWHSRSLAEHGITGDGQIVTVADSGIDTYHNFFYDKSVEVPFDKLDMNHRKIVRYDAIADKGDSKSGHGTHVCGILSGKSWDNESYASLYDGVAPDSKLYFIDVGDTEQPTLVLPYDIEETQKTAEEMGSGIMSNSFGMTEYTGETYLYDVACWSHKNFLIVKSAGNRAGPHTVASFGDAVNVFTVGNAVGPTNRDIEVPINTTYHIVSNGTSRIIDSIKMDFDLFVDENNKLIDMRNLTISTEPVKGGIYVIPNTENLQEKISKSNEAGCLFVIIEKTQNITGIEMPKYAFSAMPEIMEALTKLTTCSFVLKPLKYRRIEMHDRSSQGPGLSGVLKPDISAPGTKIMSSNAVGPNSTVTDNTGINTIVAKSGTSMATPAISGAAALMREYFVKGYYPSGKPNEADAIKKPTAALLKAALINSAMPLDYKTRENTYGYGIPNLERAMGFKEGVIYLDNVSIAPKESHTYTVEVDEPFGELTVSLAYTDIPVDYTSARVLSTTINIVVECFNGRIITGNEHNDKSDESFSALSKVIFKNAPKGKYTIHVICSDYSPLVSMEYSLAIRGRFKTQKIKKDEEKKCPAECSHNGKCVNGRCQCDGRFVGTFCQTEMYEAKLDRRIAVRISENEFPSWMKYNVTRGEMYKLTIYPDPNDIHLRFCASFEKGSVGDINMRCVMSNFEEKELILDAKDADYIYVVAYKGITPGVVRQSLSRIERPQPSNEEQESGATKFVKNYGWYLIGVLSFIVVVFIVAAIVVFIIKIKNRKGQLETSEQTVTGALI